MNLRALASNGSYGLNPSRHMSGITFVGKQPSEVRKGEINGQGLNQDTIAEYAHSEKYFGNLVQNTQTVNSRASSLCIHCIEHTVLINKNGS